MRSNFCLFSWLLRQAILFFALGLGMSGVQALVPNTPSTVVLTGRNLSIDQVRQVARAGARVEVSSEALSRLERSHRLLLAAAQQDKPIYGLNRGVGLNKDQTIFKGDAIDPAVRAISERFNRNMLLTHSVGIGSEVPQEVVRATMLVRLNTLLVGGAGVQPIVARMYEYFLNHGIHPVMFSRGSIGEADIGILPQIGLAMMGEGEVIYQGRRIAASSALKSAGLVPVKLFAKDSLSLISSNAYSAGMAVLRVVDSERFLDAADRVFSLSLEGLNGNVAPFLPAVQVSRPFVGQQQTAAHIRSLLEGSYLWSLSEQRALQDPLSYRTVSQTHGAVRDILGLLKSQLEIQVNSSDDNPTIVLDISPPEGVTEQEKKYYLFGKDLAGSIFPTASFDPLPWALNLQSVTIALSHVANSSFQRTLRLSDPAFTKLPRFLSPNPATFGYTTIQKTASYLNTEIKALSQPVSIDAAPTAGNIEDVTSNAALIALRAGDTIDRAYYLLGIEFMNAAQAVDLRLRETPALALGNKTRPLLQAFRKTTPFLDADRYMASDIQKTAEFLRTLPAQE
ncbi:histidine ammonia-lyase [Polaromonas sp. OV174]|nr:histidine ammonia-lyase [Polaromonas sp. OV174]